MFRKLLLAVAILIATMGLSFAQVDVNKADQAALDSVKGIGPVTSKAIVDERKKHGPFKDWADFENRVKGIGEKKSANLSQSGLTVNGQAKANAPAAKTQGAAKDSRTDAKKAGRADTKADRKDARIDAKASAKDGKADAKAAAKDSKSEAKASAKDAKANGKAKATAGKNGQDTKADKAAAAASPKK